MSSVRARSAVSAPVKKMEEAYSTIGTLKTSSHTSRSTSNGVASSVPSSSVPTIDHSTVGTVKTSATTNRLRISRAIAVIDIPA